MLIPLLAGAPRAGALVLAFALALSTAHVAAADSLYKPNTYQPLTSDLRARKAGDLITVLVYENASASSTADTSAGRDANVGIQVQGTGKSFGAGIKSTNQTDGRGRTQREGKVLAQITVTIKQITDSGDLIVAGEQLLEINNERQQISVEGKVLAQITVTIKQITDSGDLIVAGEQLLEINNERQQISVEGQVRPQDVSDTNTVLSTRIANARIRYSGQGDLSDKQRPAWWQRFLTLFGA